MALFARAPQPPDHLYGILDDADLRQQLTRPTSEFETLGRYPSFHPPQSSSASGAGVVGSHTTGGDHSAYLSPVTAHNTGHHSRSPSEYSQSKRSSPRMNPVPEPSQEDMQVSSDPTGQSWFNPQAESWKPKKTSSNKIRRQPPTRPAPQIPPQPQPTTAAPMYGYASPVLSQTTQPSTGILLQEPAQPFAKAKGPPRKSAMKTPGQQAQPLPPQPQPVQYIPTTPATAYYPISATAYPTQTPRQPAGILSPPSTVTNLSTGQPATNTTSWISAPPSSAGRRSAANSHYGGSSSAGTSSVAYTNTSSSYYSSSAPAQSFSVQRPGRDRRPVEDDSPIEPSVPRQTLFVVNGDPGDSSGSEKSPVLDKRPFVPNLPTIHSYGSGQQQQQHRSSSNGQPKRKHKLSDAGRMPPVPPLPPQFQAPPPPNYPPPSNTVASHQRAYSDLDSNPRSSRDRDRSNATKRSRADGHSQPPPSNPIPFPAAAQSSSRDPHQHHYRHHSSAGSSSSSDDGSSSSSSQQRHKPKAVQQKPSGGSSSSAEAAIPPEWIYPLPLTLEELYKGGTYTYRITTRLLSGEPKIQEVQIDVKPGWKTGTRIIFPDAGNERAPGVFQTMIFVVEQVHHERFTRLEGGKLVCNVDIELVEALKENGRARELRKIVGLDGKVIEFYPPKGVISHGQEMVIKGEGMYVRSKSKVVGRGDLIVRWNIKFPDQVTPDQIHRMRDIFKQ